MDSNILEKISKKQENVTSSYFKLIDEIDNFIENPTTNQKNKILRRYNKFNHEKNLLIQKIKNVWCKYDE